MFKLTTNKGQTKANKKQIGQLGEQIAQNFLEKKGLKLIEANFNCRYGELDLIMSDLNVLVFVEVKYRSSQAYGGAIHAITPAKQKKLIRTAHFYVQQKGISDNAARFDIVAIDKPDGLSGVKDEHIVWIQNAFYAE